MNEELKGYIDRMRAGGESEDTINQFITDWESNATSEEPTEGYEYTFEEGEVEGFVERMRAGGEKEQTVDIFIKDYEHYKQNNLDSLGKPTAVAEEEMPAVAELAVVETPSAEPIIAESRQANSTLKTTDSELESGSSEQPKQTEQPSKFWDTVKMMSDSNMYAHRGAHMAEVGVDMLDYAGDLYDTFMAGNEQAGASGETMDLVLGDKSPEAINRWIKATEQAEAAPVIESQQKWAESTEKYKKEGDGGFLAGFKAMIDNPQMAIDVGVSSMGMMARTTLENPASVAAATAVGAGTGAGLTALAGSVGGPVGSLIGAAGGTVQGGLMGFRLATSIAMEGSLTFSELLKEEMTELNLSYKNTKDVAAVLDMPDVINSMRRKALGRGLAIGVVDALFGKLGGAVGKTVNKASRISKVTGAVGGVLIDSAGGGIGEAAGMLVAGQEMKGEDIFGEIIGNTPGGGVSIIAANIDAKANYYMNGEKLKSKADILDLVENGTDEQLLGAKIKVTDDVELSKAIDDRMAKAVKNNKKAAKAKVQPEIMTEAIADIDAAIVEKTLEAQAVESSDGPLAAEVIKKEITELEEAKSKAEKHIDFQLDALNENEMSDLIGLDNDISLYQSMINDPSTSQEVKDSAQKQIDKAKQSQIEKFNNPELQDITNPKGPKNPKNVELSRKTQEAYEKGDTQGIINAQGGTIGAIATSLWSRVPADKQIGTYDDFKSALVTAPGGLIDLIKTYDPVINKGVPLAAYIGDGQKGLRVRANRIIKGLTKQETDVSTDSTEALNSFSSNEIDIDNIDLGPKYNSQKLGLGLNIVEEASNDVEIGMVKIENDLAAADQKAESKGKKLTQKQRQTVSEKAFDGLFKNKYADKVKETIGKKLEKQKYIKDNVTTLKKIVLANNKFQKGSGITADWNAYPPSDQEFLDFYEGVDTNNQSTISDRKSALAEAVSKQIGSDAKDAFFENNETARQDFANDNKIAFQKATDEVNDVKNAGINSMEYADLASEYEDRSSLIAFVDFFIEEGVITSENAKKLKRTDATDGDLIRNELQEAADLGFIGPMQWKSAKYGNFGSVVGDDGSIGPKTGRGGLYYGVKDPKWLAVLASAEKNYKGTEPGSSKKMGGVIRNLNSDGSINLATAKEAVSDFNEQAKINQKLVIETAINTAKMIAAGINPYTAITMLHNAMRATSGTIKSSYEFKHFESGVLEFGTGKFSEFDKNGKKRDVLREEHSPPVKVFTADILKAVVSLPIDQIESRIEDMYKDAGQALISLASDQKIEESKLGATIPSGNIVGANSGIIRLLTAGLDSKKLVDVNGISIYDKSKNNIDFQIDDLSNVVVNEAIIDGFGSIEQKLQSAVEFQEANNSNPELSTSERQAALGDMLGNVFGKKVITNKQDAINQLIADGVYPDTPEGRKDAKFAVEQLGFRTDGFIYISETKAGKDTAMHEFTHEWAQMVYDSNPELFNAIFDKLKSHPLYAAAVERMKTGGYKNIPVDSFQYKNEILADILGQEGGSMYDLFKGDSEAKNLVDQFFDFIKEALGFDPATKNFADLTVDQVIKLTVKDIAEGNPASNFNKLKNVAEGKSWYAKAEATQSPSAKAKADPLVRALNKLKLAYRKDKNLAKAIMESYNEVKGIMSISEYAALIAKNTKEVATGKSKQLLVGKAAVIKAEKIAEESAKKNEESLLSEEQGKKMADKLRSIIYGKPGKPSKWFIPPNAEDFKGLLYTFLPKGEAGVAAKKWLTETLLKPYSDAIAALDTEILNKTNAWKKLSKGFDFNKKVGGTPYTLGDAIKIYNGLKNGQDPNIAKKKHLDALIHAVESNSDVLNFANEVNDSFPIDVNSGWQNRSFGKEIFDSINDGARKRHLATFTANVDAMFTDATLDLIADQYGVKFKQALVNTLSRMKSGRNRVGTDASANSYMNWLNRAVGTTMFLNTRSAFLQTLSSLNFINKPGNNLFQAMKAFGDQKQWQADYKVLWNSDYLSNRRDGAKFDVLADEMSQGDVKGIEKILKAGFLPTRYADSFAIAMGGAAFYRNRINMLTKDGMSKADAEAQAMIDWREAAEESQQSADPSKISEIQSSSIGKLIYAFANTPFQYARLTKRKLQDLTSGRSAAEGNVQKDIQSLLYYSILQSVMFNALQNGLVALTMGNDPDDEELRDEKFAQILERTLTSYAKSIGNPGAVASTLYAMLKEGYMQQTGERRKDANVFALTATSISPPINSKLKDLSAAYRAYNKIDEKDLLTPSLDSDALTMAGEVSSFVGVPLDRVIKKTRHLAAIANEEVELWQKVWMVAGWSEWELGVQKAKSNKPKTREEKRASKLERLRKKKEDRLKSPNKKLENGVAGVANKDGTIEIDPNLSPVEHEKTVAHEEQHVKDMDSGKLDYDDKYVYWNDAKYARVNGKIKYKGKSYVEGHKSLPWEKVAYNAEPSTSAVKRKLY